MYTLQDDASGQISLCDALDRVLTKGVVAHGDIVISVAGVELIYLGVRALLCAIDALEHRPASLTAGTRPSAAQSKTSAQS